MVLIALESVFMVLPWGQFLLDIYVIADVDAFLQVDLGIEEKHGFCQESDPLAVVT
jgi:hypothetical protein